MRPHVKSRLNCVNCAHDGWVAVVRFRNVVMHEYFDVDLEIVWTIATCETFPITIYRAGNDQNSYAGADSTSNPSHRHHALRLFRPAMCYFANFILTDHFTCNRALPQRDCPVCPRMEAVPVATLGMRLWRQQLLLPARQRLSGPR